MKWLVQKMHRPLSPVRMEKSPEKDFLRRAKGIKKGQAAARNSCHLHCVFDRSKLNRPVKSGRKKLKTFFNAKLACKRQRFPSHLLARNQLRARVLALF